MRWEEKFHATKKNEDEEEILSMKKYDHKNKEAKSVYKNSKRNVAK